MFGPAGPVCQRRLRTNPQLTRAGKGNLLAQDFA